MSRPILIGGPTASGKSSLALRLAEEIGGAVINADALQVYREFSILTARPGPDALQRAPHRLYGYRSGAEPCSMAAWHGDALAAIAEVSSAGLVPIVAGGTGLYLRALTEGFSDIPPVPDPVRQAVARRRETEGEAAFFAWLAAGDPDSGAALAPGDTQRVLRAAEVLEATGKPIGHWRQGVRTPALERFDRITLEPPRAPLYAACDRRFAAMIEQGVLDEVRAFAALGLPEELPVNRALGLAPLRAHLRDETSLAEAIASGRQATRNYAKRQLTWFRNQIRPTPDDANRRDLRLPAQYSETFLSEIVSFVQLGR